MFEVIPVSKGFECTMCGECCKHWNVNFNESHRPVFEKLYKDDFDKYFKKVGDKKYKILEDENGSCLFLMENNLCKMHADFGFDIKCDVCKNYPNILVKSGSKKIASTYFSCLGTVEKFKENLPFVNYEIDEYEGFIPYNNNKNILYNSDFNLPEHIYEILEKDFIDIILHDDFKERNINYLGFYVFNLIKRIPKGEIGKIDDAFFTEMDKEVDSVKVNMKTHLDIIDLFSSKINKKLDLEHLRNYKNSFMYSIKAANRIYLKEFNSNDIIRRILKNYFINSILSRKNLMVFTLNRSIYIMALFYSLIKLHLLNKIAKNGSINEDDLIDSIMYIEKIYSHITYFVEFFKKIDGSTLFSSKLFVKSLIF